jgi:hypothetical protein
MKTKQKEIILDKIKRNLGRQIADACRERNAIPKAVLAHIGEISKYEGEGKGGYYKFDDGSVLIENGEPWFYADDLANEMINHGTDPDDEIITWLLN